MASMNISVISPNASFVAHRRMDHAPTTLLASIATGAAETSAAGVVRPQQGRVHTIPLAFTRNECGQKIDLLRNALRNTEER